MNTQPAGALGVTTVRGVAVESILILLIPPAVVVVGWFLPPVWGWLLVMALLAAFVVLVGHRVVGLWRGALIDGRNMVSLSRFQTVAWTVLVIAGFLVVALHNVRERQPEPLAIRVPPQLWTLLGISLTSLVGSSLIKQEKVKSAPDPDAAMKSLSSSIPKATDTVVPLNDYTLVAAKDPTTPTVNDPVVAQGVLRVNATVDASSWSDMFRTEEIGNIGHLDLGKIQMFFFTIVLVLSYAVALGSLLAHATGKIGDFPALDSSAIALLGISHAAYLTNKAIPHTRTT